MTSSFELSFLFKGVFEFLKINVSPGLPPVVRSDFYVFNLLTGKS